jgi:multidrug transporter EmrE-like cation transporter
LGGIGAYAALAAAILAGVIGQTLLKAGSGEPTLIAQFLHPKTIIGIGAYGTGAIFYVLALRSIPLSVAFPSVAISYVVVAGLGVFLFNEPFSMVQVGGLVLICLGVVLLQVGG